jgi:polyvinyl alcohol dehydrogenase (cytochrome)
MTSKGIGVSCVSMALIVIGASSAGRSFAQPAGQWRFAGADLHNTRSSFTETMIGRDNAATLVEKWSVTTGGDVSATPTIAGRALYVPDWSGRLYKLDAQTGGVIWFKNIPEYTGVAEAVSRTSPAISGETLVVGTQRGGHLLGINAQTGALLWKTQPDTNEFAIITQSAVIHDGVAYVGVSSSEEAAHANIPGYIPKFRGSVLALNITTGAILWQTYMVPTGYTGGAVWGSTPVVDIKRGSLYIATGNNYTVPTSVQTCIDQARRQSANRPPVEKAAAEEACLAPDDYIDAVVALDLKTGAVKWSNRVQGADTWTVACNRAVPANPCPDSLSPDYDFGSGPNLFTVRGGPELLGAGQKSGVYWTFNPDNGKVVWATVVGPGGTLGGIEWGSATDGQRVYVAIANNGHKLYRLAVTGELHNAGSWAALDAATGRILWQIKVPGLDPRDAAFPALGIGAVSVANGVMYAGSMSGDIAAIDGVTGVILKSFSTNGSVICGPSIVNGVVYWGSGYARTGGKANTAGPQLFAFRAAN